ncbi:MAG: hypothetical protein ACI90U_003167 [Pseudomonadales bacterium]|jgi:hypothetical protein
MKKLLALISLTAPSLMFAHTGFQEHVHANTASGLVNSIVAVVAAVEVGPMTLLATGAVVILGFTIWRKGLAKSKV